MKFIVLTCLAISLLMTGCSTAPVIRDETDCGIRGLGGQSGGEQYSIADASLVFYVAPGGGGDGSKASPFGDLREALDSVRSLREKGTLPTGPVMVLLQGGIYPLESTVFLGPGDSGTEDSPLVIMAGGAEEVLFTGGLELDLSAFVPVTDETVLARLPEESHSHVRAMDLRALGLKHFEALEGGGFRWPDTVMSPELFVDNQAMNLARYPNKGFLRVEDVVDEGFVPRTYTGDIPEEDFALQEAPVIGLSRDLKDRSAAWADERDPWAFGFWRWDWADDNLPVRKIDSSSGEIHFGKPSYYGVLEGARYYLYNLLSELDEEGEWYLDRESGILYFYPPRGWEESSISLSLLGEPMFSLEGASNITLRNLNFSLSRGEAVRMINTENNLLENCSFSLLGGKAVSIEEDPDSRGDSKLEAAISRNNAVKGCHIYDTGAGGITLQGGDRQTLIPGGNYAEDNHICNFSRVVRTYTPGIELEGVGNRATGNVIHDAPHVAILFKGNDHIMEENEIYDVAYETSDVGVIYTGRDWTFRGNIIRNNYIHDIISMEGHGSFAVYLDDMMSSAEITGNVFQNLQGWAILVGGGRDSLIRNNLLIDCKGSIIIDARATNWAAPHAEAPDGSCYKGLMDVPYQSEPWISRYPQLLTLWEDEPKYPKGHIVTGNVFVDSGWMRLDKLVSQYGTVENNLHLKEGKAGFSDPQNGDYSLREDSVIFDMIPDFQVAPVSAP